MSNEKKSFILYTSYKELIDELNDIEVAAVFRAVFEYQSTGFIPELSGMARLLFKVIRQDLDYNNEAWEEKKKERSEQGKTGGRPPIEDDIKKAVYEDLQSGIPQKEIAEKYGVSQATISNIKNEVFDIKNPLDIKNVFDIKNLNVNVDVNDNVNDNFPPKKIGGDAPPLFAGEKKVFENMQEESRQVQKNGQEPHGGEKQKPPENIPLPKQNGKPPDEAVRLACLLAELHKTSDPHFSPPEKHISKWADDIDKLNRIDGRSYADIEAVIRYVKTDGNFWNANIVSGKKLREKFSTVFVQMQRDFKKQHPPFTQNDFSKQDFSYDSVPNHLRPDESCLSDFDAKGALEGIMF